MIDNAKPLDQCGSEELWRGELLLELKHLETLEAQLSAIEKRLEQIAKADAQIQRVQTINGVGRVTAEAIVAYIDDPHRFKSARQVGSYAGMVPRQYQSGMTDRRGRITKRGPRLLRTLLLECAWCSLRYNQWSQETYKRIHAGKRPRKKKAAIALARKVAQHFTELCFETELIGREMAGINGTSYSSDRCSYSRIDSTQAQHFKHL